MFWLVVTRIHIVRRRNLVDLMKIRVWEVIQKTPIFSRQISHSPISDFQSSSFGSQLSIYPWSLWFFRLQIGLWAIEMTGVSAAVAAASAQASEDATSPSWSCSVMEKHVAFPSSNQFWACCGCESGVHIWKSICVDVHHFFNILLMNIGDFLLEEYPLFQTKTKV